MLAYTKAKTGLDENFFIKLYKNAVVAGPAGSREAVDQLVRGQWAITGFNSGEAVLKPIQAGAPIKPLDLKEGYIFKAVRIAAIKNAPHPNATKVYINWRLSKEGQMLVSKATDQDSVRNDVPSAMPFRFKGPEIILTYKDVELTEERASNNYMANLLGLKK
jgi:ABC-type Fe3+ transport system substrate-binding protein